ncbi:hypothetical protein [Sporosarcina luteola]|nr:hypothetical protein [Sporosarcina luteola]
MKRWIWAALIVMLFSVSSFDYHVGKADEELPGMTEEHEKEV